MAHPDWALKFKEKNVEVKKIRGNFYLYKVSHKWDPIKKQSRKITEEMLGVITEERGFIPKGQSPKGRRPSNIKTPIANKEFGATNFLQHISSDIISALKEFYPIDWESLFVLAANRLIYQATLENCESKFEKSFLSEVMQNANLEKNHLTALLSKIGNNRESAVNFMQKFIVGSKHIIFDMTDRLTALANIASVKMGYNSTMSYKPEDNLFYLFSVDEQVPIYYKMFPEKISGITAINSCLKELNLNDCILIMQKEFYSKDNILLLEESGLKYILPLDKNSSLINYEGNKSEKRKYFDDQKNVIFYKNLGVQDEKRIIIFQSLKDLSEERLKYLLNILNKQKGYDEEQYEKMLNKFGTITVITNDLEKSEKEIYESYKSKSELETVFNTYKNVLEADRNYMKSDKSMEAWILINHIATMIYYKILKLLKEEDLLKKISPQDLLEELADVRKIKIKGKWELTEITNQAEELIKKLKISLW